MKKYIIILFAFVVAFGCTKDDENMRQANPNLIDLHSLEGTEAVTNVRVTITNTTGEVVKPADQLHHSTEYNIILEGEGVDFLRISYGHIFEILEEPQFREGQDEFIYKVRTSPDFADRLLINVVPLHRQDDNFIRERAQVFTLPF